MSRTDGGVPATEQGRLDVRDIDRIREKVSISLEPRQFALLGLGFAVVMSAVFAMGLLVGEQGDGSTVEQTRAIAGAPVSGAFPAESPMARPRTAPVKDTVLKPTRVIRKAIILPAPSLEPVATARGADQEASPFQNRRGLVEIPDSVFEPDRPWPSVAVTDLAMCMSCIYEDRGGCVPPLIPLPPTGPPRVESSEAKAPPARPDPPEKVEKTVKPRKPAKKTAARKPESRQAAPDFAVQVRAYRDRASAREFADALVLKGYKPHIVRFKDGQGRGWFRVRLGRFPSSDKAQEFAARFNEKEATDAIPVAVETP